MGSCCSQYSKISEKEPEQNIQDGQIGEGQKDSYEQNKNDIASYKTQTNVSTGDKKEDFKENNQQQFEISQASGTNKSKKQTENNSNHNITLNAQGLNLSVASNSAIETNTQTQINTKMQDSLLQSNTINKEANPIIRINSNQNIQNNLQIQESGQMSGKHKNPSSMILKGSSHEYLKDDLTSQKCDERIDTQDRDNNKLLEELGQYIVKSKEQLIDNQSAKYIFMCCSNSSKSFILQMQHTKAQQQNSLKYIFDLASKYILLTYGTESISLELLFGMQNLSKSALSHSDCFPAFFKTREIFEEYYPVQVQIPLSTAQKKQSNNYEWIKLNIFSSMTAEDAKKEICSRQVLGLNSFCCVLFRIVDNPVSNDKENPTTLIPMQDEEKFGLSFHDACFILKNIDEDSGAINSGSTMVEGQELFWMSSEEGQDISLMKKGEQNRKVVLGVNIEIECKQSSCKLAGKKIVKNLGIGIFDLYENQKQICEGCQQNSAQILQIAFFQCRYGFTGIQEFKKRFANKWGLSLSTSKMKKLLQSELIKKQGEKNQPWNLFLNGWSRFKIFSKRFAPPNTLEQNEEILQTLQMEEISSHRICGVCKQNVGDQMQHTLECGHSYHKICINLLPPIFSSLSCPLCVKSMNCLI